jgi:hypothetical protein
VTTILEFARAKRAAKPIVILAAYDALMARLLAATWRTDCPRRSTPPWK